MSVAWKGGGGYSSIQVHGRRQDGKRGNAYCSASFHKLISALLSPWHNSILIHQFRHESNFPCIHKTIVLGGNTKDFKQNFIYCLAINIIISCLSEDSTQYLTWKSPPQDQMVNHGLLILKYRKRSGAKKSSILEQHLKTCDKTWLSAVLEFSSHPI